MALNLLVSSGATVLATGAIQLINAKSIVIDIPNSATKPVLVVAPESAVALPALVYTVTMIDGAGKFLISFNEQFTGTLHWCLSDGIPVEISDGEIIVDGVPTDSNVGVLQVDQSMNLQSVGLSAAVGDVTVSASAPPVEPPPPPPPPEPGSPPPPFSGVIPQNLLTTWNPGIPGGIPTNRQSVTLTGLVANGTGDNAAAINAAISAANARYVSTGVIQEIVIPAGTYRIASSILLNRSGVVLKGAGMRQTRIRMDGGGNAVRFGRAQWGSFTSRGGPFNLQADALKGSKQIVLSNANAAEILPGDILCIDEEDDPSFVYLGDARYEKRQPSGDTHGPALRAAGAWRSVTSMIKVESKQAGATNTTLTLADPLHMNFRASRFAQVFQIASEYGSGGRTFIEGASWMGLEDLYVTGGTITTNNVAHCWVKNVEIDGNPGTPNIGTYTNQGGMSGRSLNIFHAYRFEVRDCYIHHTRNIASGGGGYLLSISSYSSECLIENNVIMYGNKPLVGNMMGGGNVIGYNYVDNARTNHNTWQEGAIDLNHQCFTHNALVEGNWSTNLVSDTTHGNAGWHVFYRNFATGQNSNPLYGAYPYQSAPDGAYMRAAGTDGGHREVAYVGNVLHAGNTRTPVYQIDHTSTNTGGAAVYRIGWGLNGGGDLRDAGEALSFTYRAGNWDNVRNTVEWSSALGVQNLPPSLYRSTKPAFFGTNDWPWVDSTGATATDRLKTLPAKVRFDTDAF